MIELRGIHKRFPGTAKAASILALENIDLAIPEHEFVCVLGPSGCGKTTLLKIVAGLLTPDGGEVLIDGAQVTAPGPDRALVFQNFALLPWLDVMSNVAFGLELRGVPKVERESVARALIRSVGLDGFEHHHPRQLSGGMQQRVGLARALAVNPPILLMDEPFAAVDAQTRRTLQEDLLALFERQPRTILFVTHDMDEAARLADRVVLMTPRPGRIRECISVPLGRPRPPDLDKHPQLVELKEYLWRRLREMALGYN